MATIQEMMLENMDAAKTVETAAKMSAGDTFEGNLDTKNDEDWIRIELTAGMLYTISLSGDDEGGSEDTVLKLYDSKGGLIESMVNDDIDGAMGNLNSELEFTPEESTVYYISASAYTGNPSQDNSGAYTVTVTEMEQPDPTMGEDIVGTVDDPATQGVDESLLTNDKLFGTGLGEKISGLGGNDSLYAMGVTTRWTAARAMTCWSAARAPIPSWAAQATTIRSPTRIQRQASPSTWPMVRPQVATQKAIRLLTWMVMRSSTL
jgi:hypothetical protein